MSSGGVKTGRVSGVGTAETLSAETGVSCSSASSCSSVSSRPAPFICPETQRMDDVVYRAAEDAQRVAKEALHIAKTVKKDVEDMQGRLETLEALVYSFLADQNNPPPPPPCGS